MSDFAERRREYEKRLESLFVDIAQERTPDGVAVGITLPYEIVGMFNATMEAIKKAQHGGLVIEPGSKNNEE